MTDHWKCDWCFLHYVLDAWRIKLELKKKQFMSVGKKGQRLRANRKCNTIIDFFYRCSIWIIIQISPCSGFWDVLDAGLQRVVEINPMRAPTTRTDWIRPTYFNGTGSFKFFGGYYPKIILELFLWRSNGRRNTEFVLKSMNVSLVSD